MKSTQEDCISPTRKGKHINKSERHQGFDAQMLFYNLKKAFNLPASFFTEIGVKSCCQNGLAVL